MHSTSGDACDGEEPSMEESTCSAGVGQNVPEGFADDAPEDEVLQRGHDEPLAGSSHNETEEPAWSAAASAAAIRSMPLPSEDASSASDGSRGKAAGSAGDVDKRSSGRPVLDHLEEVEQPGDGDEEVTLAPALERSPASLASPASPTSPSKGLASTVGSYAQGVVYREKYADGSLYVGTFREGGPVGEDGLTSRDGYGRLEYAFGGTYEGEFAGDRCHNRGKLVFSSGDRYEGEFARDRPHGEGFLESKSGWSYRGQFCDGAIEGEGMLMCSPDVFTEPLDDEPLQCGPQHTLELAAQLPICARALSRITRGDGSYVGQLKAGVPDGRGRWEYKGKAAEPPDPAATTPKPAETSETSEAERCATGAVDDDQHTEASGSTLAEAKKTSSGHWKAGLRQGNGVAFVQGHAKFEGQFAEDEPSGRGVLVRWYEDGTSDEFVGELLAGRAHGHGVYRARGTIYHGQFYDGLKHGFGRLEVRGTVPPCQR
eukprot:TRINITY_DN8259_c0_g1_i5.p1 TRINITY_DN8259_c0_g1~~TRINITY_DN8259_c0_g1_i5.p1  ORF type:complete len:486 (-),score=101.62 TRINITY_DN8259_c0_g1_i5:123-1580(-)